MSGDTLVTRVKIVAYKDPLFSDRKGSTDDIELQVNPSEILASFLIFSTKFFGLF